jgi:hypothetical protein
MRRTCNPVFKKQLIVVDLRRTYGTIKVVPADKAIKNILLVSKSHYYRRLLTNDSSV